MHEIYACLYWVHLAFYRDVSDRFYIDIPSL